jgi:hypothetical protein
MNYNQLINDLNQHQKQKESQVFQQNLDTTNQTEYTRFFVNNGEL